MAADRVITCTNADGFSLTFNEKDFSPFLLGGAEGIYDVINNVHVSENSMIDGATYQGSTAKFRNIVLRLKDKEDYPENRDMLNRLFKEKETGTLVFQEGDSAQRKIEYVVESLSSTAEWDKRIHEVSLICPDPYFYDISAQSEALAYWQADFIFPFVSPADEGFIFGHRVTEKIKHITNDFAEDNIGLTITLTCTGQVINPYITRIESNEVLHIGHANKVFGMQTGDVVTITTATGNKHVTLTRNGVTTEINHYLTEDSVFIQLMRGENSIGYDASSGEDSLLVDLGYQLKYARA